MSQVERSNFRKKKITGWFRWFAFKFVTNCRLPKNNHPELVLGKQMSPRVCHSEELVKEPKEGPTLPHTPAEATGWSARPKHGYRGSFGMGPWGVAPSAAAEGPWARGPGMSPQARLQRVLGHGTLGCRWQGGGAGVCPQPGLQSLRLSFFLMLKFH